MNTALQLYIHDPVTKRLRII